MPHANPANQNPSPPRQGDLQPHGGSSTATTANHNAATHNNLHGNCQQPRHAAKRPPPPAFHGGNQNIANRNPVMLAPATVGCSPVGTSPYLVTGDSSRLTAGGSPHLVDTGVSCSRRL